MITDYQDELPGFKQVFPIDVKWGDMDAMRHVNNTRYFYYAESARLEFLLTLFPELNSTDQDQLGSGMALAYADFKFKVPVTYPDKLWVGTAVAEIAETEFQLEHQIYSTKLGCVAAQGTARLVFYDFKLGKRKAFDDKMRQVLNSYSIDS